MKPVLFNETKVVNYHALRKQLSEDKVHLDEEFYSHLDISYSENIVNWYKTEKEGRYT